MGGCSVWVGVEWRICVCVGGGGVGCSIWATCVGKGSVPPPVLCR